MRAAIVSTDRILNVDGVPCRAWRGRTDGGVEFIALIHRVAVEPADAAAFDHELQSTAAPKAVAITPLELARLREKPETLVINLRSVL